MRRPIVCYIEPVDIHRGSPLNPPLSTLSSVFSVVGMLRAFSILSEFTSTTHTLHSNPFRCLPSPLVPPHGRALRGMGRVLPRVRQWGRGLCQSPVSVVDVTRWWVVPRECPCSVVSLPHPTTVQPTRYTTVGSGLSAWCGCGRGCVPGVFSCGEYDSCASRGETNRRCLQSLKFFSFLSLAWHDLFEITQTLVNMHSLTHSPTHLPLRTGRRWTNSFITSR